MASNNSQLVAGRKCSPQPGLYDPEPKKPNPKTEKKTPRYVMRCGMGMMIIERDGDHMAVKLRCKSWRCQRGCARVLAAKWYSKIVKVKDIKLAITLTFDPSKYKNSEDAEIAGGKAFSNLIKRMRRAYGRHIEYLRVTEWHRSGWPHYHILLRGPDVPSAKIFGTIRTLHKWLKSNCPEVGLGKVCYVQEVYNHRGAASYVLSDVTKTYQLRSDYSKGLKRIQASKNFFENVDDSHDSEEKHEINYELMPKTELEAFLADVINDKDVIVGQAIFKDEVEESVPTGGQELEGFYFLPRKGSCWDLSKPVVDLEQEKKMHEKIVKAMRGLDLGVLDEQASKARERALEARARGECLREDKNV